MTLLITIFAAIITTIIWYKNAPEDLYKVGTLALMYWGASIMWMCDAVAEYIELREEYFQQAPLDMLNDSFLGLCIVAFGLILWLGILLVKDPKNCLKKMLKK